MSPNMEQRSEKEHNGFGCVVGLDNPDNNDDVNDCNESIRKDLLSNHQKSTDTDTDTTNVEKLPTTSYIMTDDIENQIDKSEQELMSMMQSFFTNILDGQKEIVSNIEKLSQRVDHVEKRVLSLASSTSSPGEINEISPSNQISDSTVAENSFTKENSIDFLRKIKVSNKALCELMKNSNDIEKIVDLCKQITFRPGEVIAREGEKSSIFFIIEGNVNCYRKKCGAEPIETISRENAFGDEIILTKSYIATSHVKCLCLPRKDCGGIFDKNNAIDTYCNTKIMSKSKIEDFEIIRNLGRGNFSTVKLAKLVAADGDTDNGGLVALKCFKNIDPDKNDSQSLKEMIENEMSITRQLESPFIVRSFGSFVSADKIYFILEAMSGGDLYQLLQDKFKFAEDWIKFYAASVLHAYTDMHSKNIVYRDLKPENLTLTGKGYIKLIDFGLSKKFIDDKKTYTCCGTLDYLAPEIILKTGHDRAVDYWALGILIFEMAAGCCPFIAEDQMKTCKKILSGKIDFPRHFSPTLGQIVQSFLQKKANKRLGCTDYNNYYEVRNQQWFKGFNWSALFQKRLKAPYIPNDKEQTISNSKRLLDTGTNSKYAQGNSHKESAFGGYF